jgi:hypothetical protein
MPTIEVENAFARALDYLSGYNQMVYDYWISEICEDDGEFISLNESKLTVENLALIQKDVREQMKVDS